MKLSFLFLTCFLLINFECGYFLANSNKNLQSRLRNRNCQEFSRDTFNRGSCQNSPIVFKDDNYHSSDYIGANYGGGDYSNSGSYFPGVRYSYHESSPSVVNNNNNYNNYNNYNIETYTFGHYLAKSCQTFDGDHGLCQPPAYCFFQFDYYKDYINNRCEQSNGAFGICCPVNTNNKVKFPNLSISIPRVNRHSSDVPNISPQVLEEHARKSLEYVKSYLATEIELVQQGIIQTPNSMEAFHQSFFGVSDSQSRRLLKNGLVSLATSISLAKKFNLNKKQARDGLLKYSLLQTSVSNHCPRAPVCEQSKYRKIDGSCNNLRNPIWGQSHTTFNRLLPSDYSDGLNELRRTSDNKDLPSPREVTLNLASDFDAPENIFTVAVMQWGQFIDHDLTLAMSTRIDSERGEGILCCSEIIQRDGKFLHPACKPILLSANDPFYSRYKRNCLNFVRNMASAAPDCSLGPREQTNQLTHYLDGSMVYGSTQKRANQLRSFQNGKLRNSIINGAEYLPFDTLNKSDVCGIPKNRRLQCFFGGDPRVNEQTGLTALHMLLLREHNRIAERLSQLNPHWNDENIYEETRRIVGAVIQHITYNEWWPLILGRRVMNDFNILLKPSGYTYDYDDSLSAAILNEFATAAFRFHTLIQHMFHLMNNQGIIINRIALRKIFNNPETIYEKGAFDGYLHSLTSQPSQSFDQFFSEEITNHLFQEHDKAFGMDLVALNIQRGRDHGLPSYNKYRQICGLPKVQSFKKLEPFLKKGSAKKMAQIYRSVDDIDLFIAGSHEKPIAGGVVGPTFACILAEQARRTKQGDRFWHENGRMIHSFREDQLNEIRKSSFAALICDNSDRIDKLQPLAFIQPVSWNQKLPCNQIARMNLDLWANEPVPGLN